MNRIAIVSMILIAAFMGYLIYGLSSGLFAPPADAVVVQQSAHPNGPAEYAPAND